jgi:hypothetical protein
MTDKLLVLGWIPLPWFLLWTTIGGLLLPGYDPVSQHASELTLVPGLPNIAVKIAVLGTGASIIGFATSLWISSGRRLSWGSICWIVFGLSMLSNGIWNMGDPRHGFYAIGVMNIVAPALCLAESRKLADDRIIYLVTVTVTLANVLYLWLMLTGNDPAAFRGLSQRLFSSLNSLWPMAVAWRMARGGGEHHRHT